MDVVPQRPEMIVRGNFPGRENIQALRVPENVANAMLLQATNDLHHLFGCGEAIVRNEREGCWVAKVQVEVLVPRMAAQLG